LTELDDRLDLIYRTELPRLRGALARRTGSVDLADDLVQDAWVEALRHWPGKGIPDRPGAWLMTTALHKAADRARRADVYATKLRLVAAAPPSPATDDDILGLVFGCCDPRLARDSQVALTLRAVSGLTTREIAAAYLVSEATMAQRISRAKRQLREQQVVFEIPDADALEGRLAAVLRVIYLVYNEGYLASAARVPERAELRHEALQLARLLDRLMPTEPEAAALLSLLELHEARAATRFDGWGRLVLLADQDRSRWDRPAIDRAATRLDRAVARRRPGPLQVQAAIATLHCTAGSARDTDWVQIRLLYDRLLAFGDDPVIRLNRAIATWRVSGPASALVEVDEVATRLDRYRLLHATRALLLTELGRTTEAQLSNERALSLATNPAERALLTERLEH
jgi:RNA polymerase sigma-70 factor (ECF subfamily)